MKILFISGREPTYVRNTMILKALEYSGTEILHCTDSSSTYIARYLIVLKKFLSLRNLEFDAVFIGFLGQPLVPIIRKLTGKPIIIDAFLSTYDTMCFDRKIFRPESFSGKFFYWLDKYSCEQADIIFLDTDAHVDFFTKTFGLLRSKFHAILVGADESLFTPRDIARNDKKFRVFYYSSFLPLHGTDYIVRAAALLRDEKDIEFIVVGKGLEYRKVRELAESLDVDNVHFINWLPYEQLPLEIARADICLGGHFSTIDKAKRVISGKTFQFIAMRKPVILGSCVANSELFTDRKNALFVTMGDARALANAILELKNNPTLREFIAEEGYKIFMQKCSTSAIGKCLDKILGRHGKGLIQKEGQ